MVTAMAAGSQVCAGHGDYQRWKVKGGWSKMRRRSGVAVPAADDLIPEPGSEA
jgi:hypothetical protein